MPYIKDKATGRFWKQFGENTVEKIEDAHPYSIGQAQTLLRIYWDEVSMYVNNETEPGLPPVWIEEEYKPDPRSTPTRTQQMRDKNLIWARLDDVWVAADVQSLTMATLLVLNATTPHTREDDSKNRRKADKRPVESFDVEGPGAA